MNKPGLIIITEGHPLIDTGFIKPELEIISEKFSKIEVYPMKWENTPHGMTFPVNVIFRKELSIYLSGTNSWRKKYWGIISKLFWSNFFQISPIKYKTLVNSVGFVYLLRRWILKLEFDKHDTIFYSYWLTLPALALAWLKKTGAINYFISRAHGYDLYNERGEAVLNHFKPYIFKNADKIFCISEHGRNYLSFNYSVYSNKFALSRLGIFNARLPYDGNSIFFEVISCSFISPVKRLDLLIKGISSFQRNYPEINIRWTHIGGGEALSALKKKSEEVLKPGSFIFKDNLTLSEIFDIYANNYFTCFVNVSKSEGLPVSIMEAQSAGIPVIATSVGGTPEIVNNMNGLLLPPDPTENDIATAFYEVYSQREKWIGKRIAARKNWEEKFSAENNFKQFGTMLLEVFHSE